MQLRRIVECTIALLLIGAVYVLPRGTATAVPTVIEDVKEEEVQKVAPKTSESPASQTYLWINDIQVAAPVIPVGLREDGSMDIPGKPSVVGWYSLGPKPGEQGNVVLAGHLNAPKGVKGVFWNLKNLEVGDEILIGETKESAVRYLVTDRTAYAFDAFPLQEVFGSHSEKMLRLITCTGDWEKDKGMYSERLVVSAVAQAPSTAYIPE